MADRPEAVRLIVGQKSSGETVYENALGIRLNATDVKLVRSPGLALGVAAGDVIRVGSAGLYTVIRRGGNVVVQIYAEPLLARSIVPDVEAIGGWWDGGVKNLTIFTIPVTAKFESIERILNTLVPKSPSVEWHYGNVYDSVDGVTPLDWWIGQDLTGNS